MSATDLLKGAVETRTTINADKLAEALKAEGWAEGSSGTGSIKEYGRAGERLFVFSVGNQTRIAREAGQSTTKLARLIGPKKPREKKERKPKK